jgi:cyclophilin family peptidyl-prolyl cis-trans isomerase
MRSVIGLALWLVASTPAFAPAQAASKADSSATRSTASAPQTPGPAEAAKPQKPSLADAPLADNEELVAVLDVTHGKESLGSMVVRLHPKYAPDHVRSFVNLAESGFYDGTRFHRISSESFVQGGDPLSRDDDPKNDGTGGPGYTLPPNPNDKICVRGAFCAAQTGKVDSGSQFFICLKDHPEWDGTYTVFGSVISGIEIADRIGNGPHKGDHPTDAYAIAVHVEKRARKVKLY